MYRCIIALVFLAGAHASLAAAQSSAAAVGAQLERPGSYHRHSLVLPGVLRDGEDLALHLGVQDGVIRQAWAVMAGSGQAARQVDTTALQLDGSRLTGAVQASVSYPGEERVYLLTATLDLTRQEDSWSGTVESQCAERGRLEVPDEAVIDPAELRWSVIGGRMLRGEVRGTVGPRARTAGTVVAELETHCIVEVKARVARWGKARIGLTFRDGALVEAMVEPRKGDRFAATVVGQEATITDDTLSATLDIDVRSEHVVAGRHQLVFEAELVGNTVGGTITSRRDGRQLNREPGIYGTLQRRDEPDGPHQRVVSITMPRAVADRTTPTLVLTLDGDEITAAVVRGYLSVLGQADVSGLVVDGDRITGTATLQFPPGSALVQDETEEATYTFDLRLADGAVHGTYAGQWGTVRTVEAEITGTVRDEAALRAADAIAADCDWACWTGPNQNLRADTTGAPLVDTLAAARLAWASERTLPGRSQVARYGEKNIAKYHVRGPASGGGTPIVADGKVFFFYVRPGASGPDPAIMAGFRESGKRTIAELWSERCDDVLLCLDAATGQTLWKSVLPDIGVYGAGKGKRGGYTAFAIAGAGHVFVTGSNGQLRCHDAETGTIRWSIANGRSELGQVIDGVLLVPGRSKGRGGLRAIDIATGEPRWQIDDAASTVSHPLRWVVDGQTRVIANADDGTVRCVDLASGSVHWTIEDLGEANRTPMSLGADILIVEAERDRIPAGIPRRKLGDPIVRPEEIDRVMVAYRLGPDAAEPLWALDERYQAKRTCPPYRRGMFYYRNITTGQVYALDATTGEVRSRQPAVSTGSLQIIGDRLLILCDPSHGHTDYHYFGLADDGGLTPLQYDWRSPHLPTSGYWPLVGTQPLADGRLILRGARGIFCYDLRAVANE